MKREASNGELRASFPGSRWQSPKSEADKGVHPEERGGPPKDGLHPFPSEPPLPSRLLAFQPLDFRFIIAYGVDLGAKHNCSESEKQETLKAQEDQQDYSDWR